MATRGSVGKLLRGFTVAGEWERRTKEGERVTDFAMAFDLSIVYTFFEKETKPSCDLQEWRKTKSDRLLNV